METSSNAATRGKIFRLNQVCGAKITPYSPPILEIILATSSASGWLR